MEHRSLTIMFTDMKGFTSRTSAQSREATLDMIKRHREQLLPVILGRGGKLIKTIGDAFLVIFESPTDAVLTGIELQSKLREHNAKVPEGEKMEVRVAVNTGEVILEEGDVYGEAVNIAARIEGLAEANEIYFTESTFLSMNKSEVPSAEIGYRILKGIPQKIKLYKVLREGESREHTPGMKPGAMFIPNAMAPLGRRAAAFAVDAVLLTLAAGLVLALPLAKLGRDRAALERTAADLVPKLARSSSADREAEIARLESEMRARQAELASKREGLQTRGREIEASRIALEERERLLYRDQELLSRKRETVEDPDTDEALIREETDLQGRENTLAQEKDAADRAESALYQEQEWFGREEAELGSAEERLTALLEERSSAEGGVTPEVASRLLWGIDPPPDGIPEQGEVEAFRESLANLKRQEVSLGWVSGALWDLLFLIYHTVLFKRRGRTIGKSLFKLKVCRTDGRPLGWFRAFFRSLFYFLSALPLGAGFFAAKLDLRQRTWHDKLSGTEVVPDA